MFRITNRVYTADAYPADCLAVIKGPGYTPPTKRFRAGILRTRKGTVLIYPNGRAIINKCKTKKDVCKTIILCANTIGIMLDNSKLVNIAGSGDLGRHLCLNDLHRSIAFSVFEPELHPGLLFYVDRVSVIVYRTGIVMFVGNRSRAQYNYTTRFIMHALNK